MRKRAYIFIFSAIIGILHALPVMSRNVCLPGDTIRFDDGGWYYGSISDSLFNGYGTMHYANGDVYSGEWTDGLWDGNGTLRFHDGDVYEGEFSNHRMHGYGTYTYADSTRYEGEFKKDKFEGFGYISYSDGGYYIGNFKNDLRQGTGVLFSSNDNSTYDGYFFEDEYLGIDDDLYKMALRDSAAYHKFMYGLYKPWDTERHFGISISYSMRGMATITSGFYTNGRFFGIDMMFNASSPLTGKSISFNEKEVLRSVDVGWNDYKSDIVTEGQYIPFIIDANLGYAFGDRLYCGYGLGFGIENDYRNCRVKGKGNTYNGYDVGTDYYKTRFKQIKFEYRIYAQYITPLNPGGSQFCLNFGWGRLEGFSIGAGIRF